VIPVLCAVLALIEAVRFVVERRALAAARWEARFAEVAARVAVRS
jgi:hypothetical protein